MQKPELGEILTAIREVEVSLDRRADRVGGAIMIMWGVIVALIAAFYGLVAENPEPYRTALGAALEWVWLAPVAVGYAASALVGARLIAASDDPEHRRQTLLDFAPAIATTALAFAITWAGYPSYVEGALLVGFAVSVALRSRAAHPPPSFRRVVYAIVGVAAVVGTTFLAAPAHASWWATALSSYSFSSGDARIVA